MGTVTNTLANTLAPTSDNSPDSDPNCPPSEPTPDLVLISREALRNLHCLGAMALGLLQGEFALKTARTLMGLTPYTPETALAALDEASPLIELGEETPTLGDLSAALGVL
jgi:hypothetical protein